jgi:hypothetical protein
MKLLINLISIYRKFIDRSLMNGGVRIQGTIKSFLYGVLQFPLPIYAKLITKYK